MLNRQFTNRLGNVGWPLFEMKAFWRFTRDLWPLLCVWDLGTLFSFWLTRNSSKFLRHHLPVPHFSALKNLDQIHALWKSYHFKIVMLYSQHISLCYFCFCPIWGGGKVEKKYPKPNQYHQNVLLCHKWIVNKNPMCLQNLDLFIMWFIFKLFAKSSWECGLTTIPNEGFLALYKGFVASFICMGPRNIIFFLTY